MAFDARAAKQLLPGENLTVDGCVGLRLVASTTRRSWTYRYRSPVDDKLRQVLIGQWPSMSVTAATIAWEDLKKRRDAGEDPALAKRLTRAAVVAKVKTQTYTVRKLCDDYLSGHVDVHRKPKGAKEMRRLIDAHIGAIAQRPASSITRSDAFDLLESVLYIPVCAQTLRGELGAAWDYALDSGRIPESSPNWWRLVMRGRLRSKGRTRAGEHIGTIKRVLSEAEVATLVPWLPNMSALVEDCVCLYLWTGTRGSEIVSMEKSEITKEPDGWWWTIPKVKTKNARHENATDLRVPLVGRALAIVSRRMADTDRWLFPANSSCGHSVQAVIGSQVANRMAYSTVQQKRDLTKMPVQSWSPHDLRRTARTFLASMGCPDPVAEAILGHMLGTYNRHHYDKERRHWLTLLDAKLAGLSKV
jgi:integrase